MSGRRKIEDRIKRKEAEILEFELKIRETRAYIQALQDAIKWLPRDGDVPAETKLRAGSAVAEARELILKAGEPLHISKLLEAMGRELSRNNRAALSGSISAYVRRGEIFTRPAPNTFGLVEFGNEPEPEGLSAGQSHQEPPPDFGMDDDDDSEIPF